MLKQENVLEAWNPLSLIRLYINMFYCLTSQPNFSPRISRISHQDYVPSSTFIQKFWIKTQLVLWALNWVHDKTNNFFHYLSCVLDFSVYQMYRQSLKNLVSLAFAKLISQSQFLSAVRLLHRYSVPPNYPKQVYVWEQNQSGIHVFTILYIYFLFLQNYRFCIQPCDRKTEFLLSALSSFVIAY